MTRGAGFSPMVTELPSISMLPTFNFANLESQIVHPRPGTQILSRGEARAYVMAPKMMDLSSTVIATKLRLAPTPQCDPKVISVHRAVIHLGDGSLERTCVEFNRLLREALC